jgi:Predicted glycosyl hydrolase
LRIHVVKPKDTLWTIANSYRVNPANVINANKLENLPNLVIGQSLIIPVSDYGSYGYIEVNAFLQPSNPEKENSIINEAGETLTYISPFSYHVNADGTLKPIEDNNIISKSKTFRIAPMLSVTNQSEKNFDTQLVNSIMTNTKLQDTVIKNILSTIKNKGYYGVIVDFERISPENRDNYNNFLRKLTATLHRQNYVVATALAPKTYDIKYGAWHGAHDYKAHGEIVDFVILMTYEWGWSGGPPLAVAPIDDVRSVINYALTVIPPKKIMMGMPFYGYDWTLPYMPGGEFAESLGLLEAVQRAAKYGAIIKYDQKSQSPYYNYIDENRNSHVVWFEDARSILAKFMLVNRAGLRGVSYWALGKSFYQNWFLLNDMFKITKVIK